MKQKYELFAILKDFFYPKWQKSMTLTTLLYMCFLLYSIISIICIMYYYLSIDTPNKL